ncbi:MAG: sigma-70 family RNA polymerase sigma factor [Bacteroidales bacterium]|nr:sigma-70 family RNA polymerase sigma factor [Bacteroidales bacterium]
MQLQEFIHNVETLRGNILSQARHYIVDADDAEDVVQEVLLKLWVAKDKIPDGGHMRNMASVVCRNVALNKIRDTKHNYTIDKADFVVHTSTPHSQLVEQEDRERLTRCIRTLNDRHRAIIRMRNVENMSYIEIAQVLGTTESSVRGMISKARLELLKLMKGTL